MKTCDLIAIGAGSAMVLVKAYLQMHPGLYRCSFDKVDGKYAAQP